MKRETANDRLDLLTVGRLTYTGDARFSAEFQYPNNWRLRIADANKSDEGEYECQISTYPPRVIQVFLCVRCEYFNMFGFKLSSNTAHNLYISCTISNFMRVHKVRIHRVSFVNKLAKRRLSGCNRLVCRRLLFATLALSHSLAAVIYLVNLVELAVYFTTHVSLVVSCERA